MRGLPCVPVVQSKGEYKMNKLLISGVVCIAFIILLIVFAVKLINHWKYERANKRGIFIDIAVIAVSAAVILFTALALIKSVHLNDIDTVDEDTKPASSITTTVTTTPSTQTTILTATLPMSTTITSSSTKQTTSTTVKKKNKSIQRSKAKKKAKTKKKAKKTKASMRSTSYKDTAPTTAYTTAYRQQVIKKTTTIKGVFAEKKNAKFKAKKLRKK